MKEDGVSRYYLWSSDGTAEGTNEVGGFGISNIAGIVAAGDKMPCTLKRRHFNAD